MLSSPLVSRTPLSKKNAIMAVEIPQPCDGPLGQQFNSLDAQREAWKAWIRSQRHEGWIALQAAYDEAGSPAAIWNGQVCSACSKMYGLEVDVIVTYRGDRLTRSLSDFARLIEIFDAHAVGFGECICLESFSRGKLRRCASPGSAAHCGVILNPERRDQN